MSTPPFTTPTGRVEPPLGLHRCIVSAEFPARLVGGERATECYVEVRVLGDPNGHEFHARAAATMGAFVDLASKMGWIGEPPEDVTRDVPGLRYHQLDGYNDVLGHLAMDALGRAAALSAAYGCTLMGVGDTMGIPPDEALAFTCVGVLPPALAHELNQIVREYLEAKGCIANEVVKKGQTPP